MNNTTCKSPSNLKPFIFLAVFIHGVIILNIDLEPTPTPPPQKTLVMLSNYPLLNTKIKTTSPPITTASNSAINTKINNLTQSLIRKIDAYAKRPRRRAISTNTTEDNYAKYLENWRHRVETIGNQNYPEIARRLKLHGDLILQVTLQANGNVQQMRIVHSSGNSVLDNAALHIVQLAAPFTPFPESIKKETDILDITRTWQFISGQVNNDNKIKTSFSMLN